MDLPVTFAPALPTSPRSASRSPFHSSARSQRHLRLVSAQQGCCRWKFLVRETLPHRARKGKCQSLWGSMARPPFRSPGTPHAVPLLSPQPETENYTCPMTSGLSLLCNSRKEFAVLPSRDGPFQDIRGDGRADDLQARGAAHVADRIQRHGAVGVASDKNKEPVLTRAKKGTKRRPTSSRAAPRAAKRPSPP